MVHVLDLLISSPYCISTASRNRNSASWVKYKSAVLFILIKIMIRYCEEVVWSSRVKYTWESKVRFDFVFFFLQEEQVQGREASLGGWGTAFWLMCQNGFNSDGGSYVAIWFAKILNRTRHFPVFQSYNDIECAFRKSDTATFKWSE